MTVLNTSDMSALLKQLEDLQLKIRSGEFDDSTRDDLSRVYRDLRTINPSRLASVSVCMIVKNEEAWIASCLSKIHSHVNEVIVYDTGSTDSTVELAQKSGAFTIQGQWKNDFSWARNQCMKRAVCEWILFLDADETISDSDWEKINNLISSPESPDLISFIQTTYTNDVMTLYWKPNHLTVPDAQGFIGYLESDLTRLMRNCTRYHFEGRVHEHLVDTFGKEKKFSSGIRIHHYGLQISDENKLEKNKKYLNLGLSKIEENPNDAYAHFELGVQYEHFGNYKDAIQCFQKAVELDGSVSRYLLAYAQALHRERRFSEAIEIYSRLIKLEPECGDHYVMASSVLLDLKKWDLADQLLARGDNGNVEHKHMFFNNLGVLQLNLGSVRTAQECFEKATSIVPQYREALQNLLLSSIVCSDFQKAWKVIEKLPDRYRADVAFKKYIAECLYQRGQYADAYNEFLSVEREFPDSPQYKFALAMCADQINKKQEKDQYLSMLIHYCQEKKNWLWMQKWMQHLRDLGRVQELSELKNNIPEVREFA